MERRAYGVRCGVELLGQEEDHAARVHGAAKDEELQAARAHVGLEAVPHAKRGPAHRKVQGKLDQPERG